MPINEEYFKKYLPFVPRINFSSVIEAKMTPGIGDLMCILNVAYYRSFYAQKEINLVLHWYHDEDFLYHFEDPETILERFHYINSFYAKKDTDVNIQHVFNSNNLALHHNRFFGYSRMLKLDGHIQKRSRMRYNDWYFRKMNADPIKKKVVIWTQVNNAQEPRPFKRPFDRNQWNKVIDIIEMQGYSVTEIDYRTPISEVFYHIRTAEACLCYEGMWHYVAKNMCKPTIVLTKDLITNYHTPDALIYKVRKADTHSLNYFHNFERRIERATEFANLQKKRLRGIHK
jgi:hypothetical protein